MGPAVVVATTVVGGLLLLLGAHLNSARRQVLLVRSQLETVRQALSQHDEVGARASIHRAEGHVAEARASASAFPLGLTTSVPLLGSPVRALSSAARAGGEAVAAGRIMVDASSSFPTSAGSGVDGHDLVSFHDAATRSQAAIGEADRHLGSAAQALQGSTGAALPWISGPAREMRTEIAKGRRQLSGATRTLSILGDLTGPSTDARLLLLSQDTLELRPTGGFIGSYGVLHFFHGTARLEKFEATEDLPPPDPVLPAPDGLAAYLTEPWSLSNANWSPDFPTTATAATDLFGRQGGAEVDGVLGLTELATARLVGALGSLQLPSYAKPVVEEGFDVRVVNEVELKQPEDVPRKKFLIELANVLFERLFNLPAEKLPKVADAVGRSIGAGDIQVWFKDPARQALLAGTSVEGNLPRTEGDFLMLVDANLTASKANLDVSKVVEYRVDRDRQGRLVGHVKVELHDDGAASSLNPFYNGYLRVYAPGGATLLRGTQSEHLGREGPYEVFSQPLIVSAQQTGVATFDYLLPESVGKGGSYRLTWLRQIGTPHDRLRLTVKRRTTEGDPVQRSFLYDKGL